MHHIGMNCGGSAFRRLPSLIYTRYQAVIRSRCLKCALHSDHPGQGWAAWAGFPSHESGSRVWGGAAPLPWEIVWDLFQVLFQPRCLWAPGKACGASGGVWGRGRRPASLQPQVPDLHTGTACPSSLTQVPWGPISPERTLCPPRAYEAMGQVLSGGWIWDGLGTIGHIGPSC